MRHRWDQILAFAKNAHELITLALFYFAIFGFHLGATDLEVTYDLQDLAPAAALSRALGDVEARGNLDADALRSAAKGLTQSDNLLRIELLNRTYSRVTDVEISVNGVASVVDSAVASTSQAVNRDSQKLAVFVASNNIITFPNIKELPPRSRLTLLLWGKIPPPMFGPVVQVQAGVPHVQVVQRGTASGYALFVARNAKLITFVLVSYFSLLTLARTRRQVETSASTP